MDGEGADDAEPETPAEIPAEFDEVKEQALAEAELKSALDAFLTDLQDRLAEGQEVDLSTEAAALGLTVSDVNIEGYEREDIEGIPGWGSFEISSQLMFTGANQFLPRVTVSSDALTIARVTEKIEAAEPPFEEIREDVVNFWIEDRAGALAVERLAAIRDGFGVDAAEDPAAVNSAAENTAAENSAAGDSEAAGDSAGEHEDAMAEKGEMEVPTASAAAFEAAVRAAGFEFYDREYFGRGELPDEDEANSADRHVRVSFQLYQLEEGQIAAPAVANDGDTAFLVRFDSTREKDPGDLTPNQHGGYRDRIRGERFREAGARLFRGDGVWMTESLGLKWPQREARAAEEEVFPDDPPE